MKISGLKILGGNNGRTIVEVWADCHTVEDIDDIIAWLQMAKTVMIKWDKINEKATRKAKAAAGKDEASQQGEVQGASQQPGGANREHPVATAE